MTNKLLKKWVEARETVPTAFASKYLYPTLKKAHVPHTILPAQGIIASIDPEAVIIRTLPNSKELRLIGKGITFDTGAYNMKLSEMEHMYHDKAGACLAIYMSIVYGAPATVVLARNMIKNNTSYLPGMKTKIGNQKVYVKDTDAEGRLVLAELLALEDKLETKECVCIATLTGHAAAFLGDGNGALLHTENVKLQHKCIQDKDMRLWPAPDYPNYKKVTKYKGGYLSNYSDSSPDSMYAYQFLQHFHPKVSLIDMAAELINTDTLEYSGWGPYELEMLLDEYYYD